MRTVTVAAVLLGCCAAAVLSTLPAAARASKVGALNFEDLTDDRGIEGYSAVLHLDSILDVGDPHKRGWEVSFERGREAYDRFTEHTTGKFLAVAVLGNFNRGKTFVLNMLAGSGKFPAGSMIATEGISMRLPDDDDSAGLVFVDTAGMDRPTGHSDVKIIVVNTLTLPDQRYVAQALANIQTAREQGRLKGNQSGIVYMVHNYKDFGKLADVEHLIHKDIVTSFRALKSPGKLLWTSHDDLVFHFVLAKEGTKAGEAYNYNTTHQMLVELHNSRDKRVGPKDRSFLESIVEEAEEHVNDYLAVDGVPVKIRPTLELATVSATDTDGKTRVINTIHPVDGALMGATYRDGLEFQGDLFLNRAPGHFRPNLDHWITSPSTAVVKIDLPGVLPGTTEGLQCTKRKAKHFFCRTDPQYGNSLVFIVNVVAKGNEGGPQLLMHGRRSDPLEHVAIDIQQRNLKPFGDPDTLDELKAERFTLLNADAVIEDVTHEFEYGVLTLNLTFYDDGDSEASVEL